MSNTTDHASQLIRRDAYRPPDWLIDNVELYFDIRDPAVEVRSRLHLRRNGEHAQPLVLAGRKMTLLKLLLDGQDLGVDRYSVSGSALTIDDVPDEAVVEIHTRIDPNTNTSLEGLYAAGDMLCTQCEAHGFSRISYFLDRPDVLSRYTVSIEANTTSFPHLLSNGNCVEKVALEAGRQCVVWEDPHAKPCYLFALVAGDLAQVSDFYRTASGREVAIEFYVEHGREGLCAHAIDALKQAMAWDEQIYGLEYDLDIYMVVAVSSFNMGAMENKGLNVFNDRYVLVSPETATDTDYELVTAIIGHEYFHNWTGNRVTCRDWFQLSLKEGLTVFREQQFMQDCVGGSTQRIEQVRMLRERQFPEDAGPLAHPVRPDSYIEINNFYTATVYEKGAELVRMLHSMLGQAAFARALRAYLQAHDGQAATIEDFVSAMQAETDIDLQQFFLWYSQAGTPQVTAAGNYDPASKTYELKLSQHCAATPGQDDKQPLLIPLQAALLGDDGEVMAQGLIQLSEEEQNQSFKDLASAPTPVLLRGFSAPVLLDYDYQPKELARIALHEADGYSRWEAMQRLFSLQLIDGIDSSTVIATCAELLGTEQDKALLAALLCLPSEGQLVEQAAIPVQLEDLLQRRDSLQSLMGSVLAEHLKSHLLPLGEAVDSSYSPERAAERRMHATALHLLLQTDSSPAVDLAQTYYLQAQNMSERLSAMQALRDVDCPQRDAVMQDFRQRWDANPLVLDKWFALQACSRLGSPALRVRDLMSDAGFVLNNPNRVRSLIGAFAMNNLRGLHAVDGSGYALLAEVLPQLDALNPQVSARLAQCLSQWRRLDGGRQVQIQDLLDTLSENRLSSDLFEIIGKIRGDS